MKRKYYLMNAKETITKQQQKQHQIHSVPQQIAIELTPNTLKKWQARNEVGSSVPTIIEREPGPKKLRRHNEAVVVQPKQSTRPKKSRTETHVQYPKEGRNNLKRIGLNAANKKQIPRPIKNSRLGGDPTRSPRQLYSQTNSSIIPGRQASTARVGPSGPAGIQSRLKKKSPWFSSIMSPIDNAGVKIPDAVGTDTATYQHVENVSVAVNAQGVAGLRIISPYINNYHYGSADDDGSNYQTTTDISSVSDLQWGVIPTPGQGAKPFARIPAIMKSTAQSHRVVSASVVMQPEISTLNDAGEMCTFVKPFDCNDSNVAYSTLQSQWDSALMPVNKHSPMIARWYPIDSDYEIFNTVESVVTDEPDTISYQTFIDPDVHWTSPIADQGIIPWEIGGLCTGMTPSTGVVRFQIVVNYELVPKTQTAMIDSEPSPIDPMEEQLVCSWTGDATVTGPVSQKQASKPAEASTVQERNEPTGFGMLFNVVQEMAPLIKLGLSAL